VATVSVMVEQDVNAVVKRVAKNKGGRILEKLDTWNFFDLKKEIFSRIHLPEHKPPTPPTIAIDHGIGEPLSHNHHERINDTGNGRITAFARDRELSN